MQWEEYIKRNVINKTHVHYPEWRVSGVWEFTRSDGLKTAHKTESPFFTWQRTVEESMKWADAHIVIGADLPDGMRSRHDPLYSDLLKTQRD